MSYILDALRKSDQQRQRGTAPTLLAVQEKAATPGQPALLAYGLLAAVLVGVGVMIGWLRPWQSEQPAPATPEFVAARPVESKPLELTPLQSTPLQSTAREPAPPSSGTVPQPQPDSEMQLNPAEPAPPESAPRPQPKRPPRATVDEAGPPREAGPAATERAAALAPPVDLIGADGASGQAVIEMGDLPVQVLQTLPAMAISFHAYSNTSDGRLVGINNRIRREGDTIAPGLLLEQITPEGMIFGYQGYRFRRGVK